MGVGGGLIQTLRAFRRPSKEVSSLSVGRDQQRWNQRNFDGNAGKGIIGTAALALLAPTDESQGTGQKD